MIDRFQGEYRFLSNFYPSEILWPTLEHHYQIAKAEIWRDYIMSATSPGEAKRFGHRFPADLWAIHKLKVMETLLDMKFKDPDLAQLLKATGDQELIEGNAWGDRFWGMTLNSAGKWEGQNHLGKLLMAVRAKI